MAKKLGVFSLAVILCLNLLAGCGGTTANQNNTQKPEQASNNTQTNSETQNGAKNEATPAIPNGDVTMLVGSNAGGTTDLASRCVAKYLTELTGNNFNVTNIPGANGNLGYLIATIMFGCFLVHYLHIKRKGSLGTKKEVIETLTGVREGDYNLRFPVVEDGREGLHVNASLAALRLYDEGGNLLEEKFYEPKDLFEEG